MGRVRKALIAAAAAALVGLAVPGAASALVYCVDVMDPACTNTSTDFQDGLDDAEASAGPDTVLLGSNTYTAGANGFDYDAPDDAPVSIGGAGQVQTIVTMPSVAASESIIGLDTAATGHTVSDLTIRIPAPTAAETYIGVQTNDVSVSDVTVSSLTASDSLNAEGMRIARGSVDDTTIALPLPTGSGFTSGIRMSAVGAQPLTVTDAEITANRAVEVSQSGTGDFTMRRSELTADQFGIVNPGGDSTIESTTVRIVNPYSFSIGVAIGNPNNGAAETMDVVLDGLTLQSAGAGFAGITVEADDPVAGIHDDVGMTLANSVIDKPGTQILRHADDGDTATVTTRFSNYDDALVVDSNNPDANGTSGTGSLTETNRTELAPGFVNAATGDLHLSPASPLIDIGEPAAPASGALDVDGEPRAVAGLASCTGYGPRDIGADEAPMGPTGIGCPTMGGSMGMGDGNGTGQPAPVKKKCKRKKKAKKGASAAAKKCKRKKKAKR